MADFRNKQWFKALTEEQREALCKKLGCTMNGLKKAGFMEDGKLKFDLLRLEYPTPPSWGIDFNTVESEAFKKLYSQLTAAEDLAEILTCLEDMWNLFQPGTKFLKPDLKKSVVNVWIRDCKRWITSNVESIERNRDHQDQDVPKVFAHKVYTHLRVLFNSELKNIKESK